MPPRSCSNRHFINAIKGNAIVKQRNVNVSGKSSLKFKTMKDILEKGNYGRPQPSTHSLQHSYLEQIVEKQSIVLPVVDRSLRELELEEKEYGCLDADNEIGKNTGEDSAEEMTLKQFKKKCKTKKRKRANPSSTNTEYSCVKLEPEEYDSDLDKPLISLKSKLPKAKRKRIRAAAKSPEVSISSNSVKDPDNEMQLHLDSTLLHVKTEVPEPDVAPLLDDLQTINLKDTTATEVISNQTLETTEFGNTIPLSFSEEYGSCVLNQNSYDHLEDVDPSSQTKPSQETIDPSYDEKSCQHLHDYPTSETELQEVISNQTLETTECGNTRPLSFSEEHGSCVLNQMSYHHLVDVDPFSQTKPSQETIDPSYDEKSCQHLHDFPTSETETQENIKVTPTMSSTKDQSLEINKVSSNFVSSHELFGTSCNSSPVTKVPNLRVNDCTNSMEVCDSWQLENSVNANFSPDQQLKGLTSPASGLSSSESQYPCSGTVDNLFSSEDSTNGATNCLDTGSRLVMSGEGCSLDEQGDTIMSEERNSYPNSGDNEITPTKVSAPPPERLLLTRKVVSPSSQERISLAMNSKELHDQNDCKGNICPGKECGNEASSVAESPKSSGSENQIRGNTSLSILKKLKTGRRRNPLPKGNLEGPRLSHSMQNFSTGCTSLQGCSESAIAFSKRQMQDIESLAMKLMGELNSMKDIMEGKLLPEAHQTSNVKYEAEEVKRAITKATKTEETTRRWLSIMGRDCSRFCKIMSLKQSGSASATADATNNNVVPREGKKIAFADEAGGILCHVKFFEDDMKLNADIRQEDVAQ